MASIREVAKLAHVAPSTVSRALNGSGYVSEKSKNKIKKAVEELDYIPNQWIRNLYKKRTGIIGVMTPDIIHICSLDNLQNVGIWLLPDWLCAWLLLLSFICLVKNTL